MKAYNSPTDELHIKSNSGEELVKITPNETKIKNMDLSSLGIESTPEEIDGAVAKANSIPAVTSADAGKVLGVTEEGEIAPVESSNETKLYLHSIRDVVLTLSGKGTATVNIDFITPYAEKIEPTQFATIMRSINFASIPYTGHFNSSVDGETGLTIIAERLHSASGNNIQCTYLTQNTSDKTISFYTQAGTFSSYMLNSYKIYEIL